MSQRYQTQMRLLSDHGQRPCWCRGALAQPCGPRDLLYLGGRTPGVEKRSHWITLVSGDVLDVPGGLRHAWSNRSSAPVALPIVTNMRLGRFLREIGRPAATVAQSTDSGGFQATDGDCAGLWLLDGHRRRKRESRHFARRRLPLTSPNRVTFPSRVPRDGM
jgi:hypothetical protein